MLLALRVLSVLAAAVIAVLTLMSRASQRLGPILAEGEMIGNELSGVLPLVIVGLVGVILIGLVWKTRLAARLKLSWPLFVLAALYLVGFVAIVSSTVRGTLPGPISNGTAAWLHRMSAQVDAPHAMAYAGFAVIVALAWRDKVGVVWLAAAMFAFGFVLELLQEFVPTREYHLADLASNGLGIVVGLVGLAVFDLIADAKDSRPARSQGHRRRRRSSRSAALASAGSKRAGVVTMLAGLLIVFFSVLVGSVVELRLAQVGWQILRPFSAAYALTFWLGVAVMVAGLLMLRGWAGGGRHDRTRSVRLP